MLDPEVDLNEVVNCLNTEFDEIDTKLCSKKEQFVTDINEKLEDYGKTKFRDIFSDIIDSLAKNKIK